MTTQSQQSPQTAQTERATREDIRRDLQASMEARRELGPGYDEHFLDALVEKLTKHSQQMQQMQQAPQRHVSADNHVGEALALGICSLIFGIPIVAITNAAGLPALIVACAMIVGVNIAFNFRR